MRTEEEIKSEIKNVEKKLREHEMNYNKFDWQPGSPAFNSAEKTAAYMKGWINALKKVISSE